MQAQLNDRLIATQRRAWFDDDMADLLQPRPADSPADLWKTVRRMGKLKVWR